MFAAIPGRASPSSPNRRGPSSSASTTSRLQRSPTRSRAASSGERGRLSGAVRGGRHRPMVPRSGLASGFVSSNLQVTSHSPLPRAQHYGVLNPMSAIEEIGRPSPASQQQRRSFRRRHRPQLARVRRGRRRRQGPHQRPQPARRRSHRHVRRRALDAGHRHRCRRAMATWRSSRSTRPARRRSSGGPATASRSARRCSASRPRSAAGRGSRSGSCRRCRARSAGRAADGSPAASSTPRRWRRARRAGPIVDADGNVPRPQHEPDRRGVLPRAAGRCRRCGRGSMRSGRGESRERLRLGVAIAPSHVARRLRRSVGLPIATGILVRGVEEGAPADAAGIEAGDLIVSAGGRPIAMPTTCSTRSAASSRRSSSGSCAGPRSGPCRSAAQKPERHRATPERRATRQGDDLGPAGQPGSPGPR